MLIDTIKMKGRFNINAASSRASGKSLLGTFNFVRYKFKYLCTRFDIVKEITTYAFWNVNATVSTKS